MDKLYNDYILFLNQKQNFYKKLETIINKEFLFVKKNKIFIVKEIKNYYGYKVICFEEKCNKLKKIFCSHEEISDVKFFEMYENKEIKEK